MKKHLLICSLLSTILSLGYAGEPIQQAQTAKPAVEQICRVDGQLSGGGLSIGIGAQVLRGDGYITCIDEYGHLLTAQPVQLRFFSAGIGVDLSWVRNISFQSAPVKVTYGFGELLDTYSVGTSAGIDLLATGVHYDSVLMMRGNSGIAFESGLSGREALAIGFKLHRSQLRIIPM